MRSKKHPAAYREFRSLGLSIRIAKILVDSDVLSIRELAKLSEWDLTLLPGIGPKGFSLLRKYVRKNPKIETKRKARIVVTIFSPDQLMAIDGWAEENKTLTRSDTVRCLVALGLTMKR